MTQQGMAARVGIEPTYPFGNLRLTAACITSLPPRNILEAPVGFEPTTRWLTTNRSNH